MRRRMDDILILQCCKRPQHPTLRVSGEFSHLKVGIAHVERGNAWAALDQGHEQVWRGSHGAQIQPSQIHARHKRESWLHR